MPQSQHGIGQHGIGQHGIGQHGIGQHGNGQHAAGPISVTRGLRAAASSPLPPSREPRSRVTLPS
jgi:hypothetical protein